LCGTNELQRLAFVLEGSNPQMTKKTILAMVALEEELKQNQKGVLTPNEPDDLEEDEPHSSPPQESAP